MLYADTKEAYSEVGEGFTLSNLASKCFGSLTGEGANHQNLNRNGKSDSVSELWQDDEQKKLVSILSAQSMVLKEEIAKIKKKTSSNSKVESESAISLSGRFVSQLF